MLTNYRKVFEDDTYDPEEISKIEPEIWELASIAQLFHAHGLRDASCKGGAEQGFSE